MPRLPRLPKPTRKQSDAIMAAFYANRRRLELGTTDRIDLLRMAALFTARTPTTPRKP